MRKPATFHKYPMTPSDTPNFHHSHSLQSIHRRGVLGILGWAGLGMLASSETASALPSKKNRGTLPSVSVPTSSSAKANADCRLDLPDEWNHRHGAPAAKYLRYLNTLNLKRVCPKQVIENHARAKGAVWNTLPPQAWWTRMGYTLRVVDRIAMEMNISKVEVVSAYRNPAYNARCPGAKTGSYHQANVAADVVFPVRASKVTATARDLRNRGLFKGGVGGYRGFTHIDTRGKNANW